jgi:16S rRNA G966 N2-methylase RsmD
VSPSKDADQSDDRALELEQLRKRLAEIENQQDFGLNWRQIPEAVEEKLVSEIPVLVHEPSLDIHGSLPSFSPYVLIEGDNLHALHVLSAAHSSSFDVIYIDPPYNTGKDFKYNDTLVDRESTWRHSAWLSFMSKRLSLAKELLTKSGMIIISIDDYEGPQLQLLADRIFGEGNRLGPMVWFYEGVNDNTAFIKRTHEYVLIYQKSSEVALTKTLRDPNVTLDDVIENSVVKNGPKNPESSIVLPVGFPALIEFGRIAKSRVKSLRVDRDIEIRDWKLQKSVTVTSGWSSREILQSFIDAGCDSVSDSKGQSTTFAITAAGNIVYRKQRDQSHVLSVLRGLGTVANAGADLEKMGVDFDFPKPVGLIKYLLQLSGGKSDVVLDFFAGSGTTLHAVAELNALDGGSRRCILVTNNENEICREVTHPRIKAVLTGEWADGEKHDPLPGSLSFYRTGFIDRGKSVDGLRRDIAKYTVDLIAIKEAAGKVVSRSGELSVLHGAGVTVAVAPGLSADHGALRAAAEKKVRDGDRKVVYVFTWSDQGVEEEVAALWPGWDAQPLPAEMLAALRRHQPQETASNDVDESEQAT